jgi:HlyD family secretion protein
MKRLLTYGIVILIVGTLGWAAQHFGQRWLAERNKPRFKTAKLETGDLRLTVNASGEINPVLKVKIGSFVSGPILKLHVDYNAEVKAGDLLAEIDPRIYDAAVDREQASLQTRLAEVDRVKAELQRAKNDEQRANALKAENEDFISQTELDQYRFSRMGLEAQLKVAEAGVQQAQASLENSEANVEYTRITAPVDGVVVDRKIDPGQTLAAQFQTPELFVIAPGMKDKMHIQASVDEADIGLIKQAQAAGRPVYFSVDAYPDEVFRDGSIEQIRLSPIVNQQVVTYPVIVATPNPELKLLPGMTANLTFLVAELKDVLKIPNAALRYYPDKVHVREADQKYLEMTLAATPDEDEDSATSSLEPPVDEAAAAAVAATKRIVWVQETTADVKAAGGTPHPAAANDPTGAPQPTGRLKAVEIMVGDSDYRFTRVLGGDLKSGDEIVVGLKPPGTP